MIKKLAILFIFAMMIGATIYFILPNTTIIHMNGAVVEKSLNELVVESDLIVKGKITGKLPSRWSNPNFERGNDISNILQTDFKLSLNEVLKGTPYDFKMITLRVEGGETETVQYIVEDMPKLEIGQEVITFLSHDDSDVAVLNEKYYILTGLGQGLYIKEPHAQTLYTCFYDINNQNIIEESIFRKMINDLVK